MELSIRSLPLWITLTGFLERHRLFRVDLDELTVMWGQSDMCVGMFVG